MSRIEFHTGKLKLISDNPEKFAQEFLKEKRDFYDTYLEALLGEHYNRYVLLDNQIFEYIEHEENEDSDTYFCKLYRDSSGNLCFISNFHNGGTCLPEMLEEGYKQFIKNGESYKES